MLGIAWGLVTVVLLLGYGQSVGNSVVGAFLGIGNNVIMVWGGQTSMQAGGQRAGKRIRFEYEDAEAIRNEAPLVKNVSLEDDDIYGFNIDLLEGHPVSICGNAPIESRARPLL
jgi:putative ABC transport system permease protein